ncbi:MAG: type II CRISPR RNA-guided endonuclease Cas9 [Bacteroidales bacterium]|jgi:CRISPR-associated endonuclease Csn1|nr:type II CRISPR RNA-guided endonuclease Cas9 [Bacteroidales bacterium]
MKKILGLDLGTTSIGWAMVNEKENESEKSSIISLGVRVNPLTADEKGQFEKGQSITTNASRTLKRSARRNNQRYKLRRERLIKLFKENHFIENEEVLSHYNNNITFETYRLRAKAVNEKITLEEFARILLMINKKRGYKSSRRLNNKEDGDTIDGMSVAKLLKEKQITPGQYCLKLFEQNLTFPEFYPSDLQDEFDRIYYKQQEFYPSLTEELKEKLKGKNQKASWAILAENFSWIEEEKTWDETNAKTINVGNEKKLVGIKREKKGKELKEENLQLRVKALNEKIDAELLATVLQQINGEISSSSAYLGKISDRSKDINLNNLTIGQYLMKQLDNDPNASLTNQVFFRQDYLDEFNILWDKQAEFYSNDSNSPFTLELKKKIRDEVIFYQRRLKSQKGLISFCEFEKNSRVIPRSSPLFQEFKIWQQLNNIELFNKTLKTKRPLNEKEKQLLSEELFIKDKLSKKDVLDLLFDSKIEKNQSDLNYKQIDGNKTGYALYSAYNRIIEQSGHTPFKTDLSFSEVKEEVNTIFSSQGFNCDILDFNTSSLDLSLKKIDSLDSSPYYKLWHLLYSFEGDDSITGIDKLIRKLQDNYGFDFSSAKILSNVTFLDDYASLSAKAIKKILPYLKQGKGYDEACPLAGYSSHSHSLTKEEMNNKVLKDSLNILPKNSLRNPVVEKILNQMINLINTLISSYGKPDEIRVELARELKKNAKEREDLTKFVNSNTKNNEGIKEILQKPPFNISHVSRNDIIRYKLYEELKGNEYKTLYSKTYISKEMLFSKEFDIEHIIPQSVLFDDSLKNKTLEKRDINLEKGNKTAYDFIKEKYGEKYLEEYLNKVETLFKDNKNKLKNLKMKKDDIPEDFLNRDLNNSQYIAKKALAMLNEISTEIVATTGSITAKLREDWQLVDIMKELNKEKYEKLDLVEYYNDKDGRRIYKIKDWTKRNDHRHHAMDALTVAFTKRGLIQYFNNVNASETPNSNAYALKQNNFSNGKVILPMENFRNEAKKHLENILISIKAKNKVVTKNKNITKKKEGKHQITQLTPRGQLHNETIYGKNQRYLLKEESINGSFNEEKINRVSKKIYREALLKRLNENNNDPKKAFTGKNALNKTPIYLDTLQIRQVPQKVDLIYLEDKFTIRKPIDGNLPIDKVIDTKIKRILEERLKEYDNKADKAFANLDENPIWLNKEKGIKIKRVAILDVDNATPLHDKIDKYGNKLPKDYVQLQNNHHAEVFKNGKGELKGRIIPFFECVARANNGDDIINKQYKNDNTNNENDNYEFLFSIKPNEYFIIPSNKFPTEELQDNWIKNPDNYSIISPNLFRIQKMDSSGRIHFRHHLETRLIDRDKNVKKEMKDKLKEIAYTSKSISGMKGFIKVRINHIGQIVDVGEY